MKTIEIVSDAVFVFGFLLGINAAFTFIFFLWMDWRTGKMKNGKWRMENERFRISDGGFRI